MSIQIEHASLGQVLFVTFYGHQDSNITLRRLEDIIVKLKATGFCFVIAGDFNISSEDMSQWLPTNHPRMQLRDGGNSCFTPISVSTIDYFMFHGQCCAMDTSVRTLDTSLATHRPVKLTFNLWNNTEVVNWMPRGTRPPGNLVIGPSLGEANTAQWDRLQDRISSAMPNEPLFYGMKNTNCEHTKFVDSCWDAWQHLANIEIRANFAVPDDHKLGGFRY